MENERRRIFPSAVDKDHLQAVLGVLRHHELASGLSDSVLLKVALEAVAGRHLQDSAWLTQRLSASHDGSVAEEWDELPSTGQHPEATEEPSDHEAPTTTKPAAASQLPTITVSPPAVIRSQADLDEVVRRHREWMEAVLDPQKEIGGGRANLRGTDLSGLSLQGVNMSCADFTEAILIGTQLSYANLSRCKFNRANLQQANLRGAKLKKAQLTDTDLSQADLSEVDLAGVDLSAATLKETILPSDHEDL